MSICTKVARRAMLLAIVGLPHVAAAQNLRQMAREHALRNPGVALEQPAPPGEYLPKSIEELAKEADVVLVGRLSKRSSYLTPSEDRLLTDYTILEPRVIAGQLPTEAAQKPGPGVPLTVTVYGGEVVLEGVRVRGTDNNREAIREGRQYLLFLKESRRMEPSQYEIYHGGVFDISNDEVTPLLKSADTVFKGSVDRRLQDMIVRIRAASQGR